MQTTTKSTSGTKRIKYSLPAGFDTCCYYLKLAAEAGEVKYGQGKSGFGWEKVSYGKWGKDYLHIDGEPVMVHIDRCPFCRNWLPLKIHAPSKTN